MARVLICVMRPRRVLGALSVFTRGAPAGGVRNNTGSPRGHDLPAGAGNALGGFLPRRASPVAGLVSLPAAGNVRYWTNSGQRWILARDGLSANDPSATFAVRCGNSFDAGFSPYQNTRLSR